MPGATRFERDVERLLDLMDEGAVAMAAQDVERVSRCATTMNALMQEMAVSWNGDAGVLSVQEQAVADRLTQMCRDALDRIEHSQRQIGEWMGQTQDALRVMKRSQEAIGRYGDSLGAHRRELFDLSA